MSLGVPRISPRVVLLIGVVLLPLLVGMGVVTLVQSVTASHSERRLEDAKDRLRPELFDRLAEVDPEWDAWVEDLDDDERAALEALVETYLRRLRGGDARQLRALGGELGIPEREREGLAEGGEYRQLRAMTWLALLDESVDPEVIDPVSPEVRGAGARLLYEVDHPDATDAGTDLLLEAGETMTTLGVDTLYQLHKVDPGELLERAARDHEEWSPGLTIQVLQVIGECDPASPEASLEWMADCIHHESPEVRAAVPVAMESYGWRRDLRSALDLGAVTADPSPRVRRAVYRTLATWGDEDSLEKLARALEYDDDDRCRLAAARALLEAGVPPFPNEQRDATWQDLTGERAWNWVTDLGSGPYAPIEGPS